MKQKRWTCRICGATGWRSSSGTLPAHDRPQGGSCRASGQRTEREFKHRLGDEIAEQERGWAARDAALDKLARQGKR
jgi:hypothetical protein